MWVYLLGGQVRITALGRETADASLIQFSYMQLARFYAQCAYAKVTQYSLMATPLGPIPYADLQCVARQTASHSQGGLLLSDGGAVRIDAAHQATPKSGASGDKKFLTHVPAHVASLSALSLPMRYAQRSAINAHACSSVQSSPSIQARCLCMSVISCSQPDTSNSHVKSPIPRLSSGCCHD